MSGAHGACERGVRTANRADGVMTFPNLNKLCLWGLSRLQAFDKAGDLGDARTGTRLMFFLATAGFF